jgi:hypothetical protein
LNPDPHFSEFVVVGCIRIRIYHRWAKTADKKEKIKKCVVVKCWNLSLEAGGFSCSLGINILQFLYLKNMTVFLTVNFIFISHQIP